MPPGYGAFKQAEKEEQVGRTNDSEVGSALERVLKLALASC